MTLGIWTKFDYSTFCRFADILLVKRKLLYKRKVRESIQFYDSSSGDHEYLEQILPIHLVDL